MAANVIYMHGRPPAVGHFLRVGHTGHRQLQDLIAGGILPLKRAVFRAGVVAQQRDVVKDCVEAGFEISLDTEVAELSVVGRFDGSARNAPWAVKNEVLRPDHFLKSELFDSISECVAVNRFNRVLAPAHFIHAQDDPWLQVDLNSVRCLRKALDQNGRKDAKIDYPLIIPKSTLDNKIERKAIIQKLRDQPIDSLWLRISNFGADATGVAIIKFILDMEDFHALRVPIVADAAGGLAALSLLAFGAVSGIAHGAAEGERFDAGRWFKPKPDGRSGGGTSSIFFPGLDRTLTKAHAEALMGVPHARRLLGCQNPNCCPRGFDDTLRNPRAHHLRQRSWQCDAISSTPISKRVRNFLDTEFAKQDRVARQAAMLKVDEPIKAMLTRSSHRLDRARALLEKLADANLNRSVASAFDEWNVQDAKTKRSRA